VRVKTETPPPSPAGADKLLNAKQVAERLQVHVATVYRLAESGRLAAMRLGSGEKRRRGFRCWESAVDAYLGESEITPTATEVA
jgi:excisionase family DNA binding protein